nr:hypothetical protein [Candidatus Cloacimonadota bacterium]
MAIPIINNWRSYFDSLHEGMGSSYERIILNRLILSLHRKEQFESALESPCFGFTGITGINLVALAQSGCDIYLEDHSAERISLIRKTWLELGQFAHLRLNDNYRKLDYPDKSIDFGFNFSALWFVDDLPDFLGELCRVIKKDILLCVPNKSGIGFKGQLKGYSPELYPELKLQHIDTQSIVYLMKKNGWSLVKSDYIDCPPWPDIGMSKEDYLARLLGKKVLQNSIPEREDNHSKALSILPYYRGEDPDFEKRMLRFYPFEMLAPHFVKRFWAHHYYMLFKP